MMDEDGSISVLDDAFARSKLPTPAPFQDEPLGADSWGESAAKPEVESSAD